MHALTPRNLIIFSLFYSSQSCLVSNDQKACHATNPNSLNIHIVCHTHLDTGWVETYDEYYHRCEFWWFMHKRSLMSNPLLTQHKHTDVKIIYDSVVSTLSERPDRKFIVVEVSFFSRWYNDQDDVMRKRVHWLVESGMSVCSPFAVNTFHRLLHQCPQRRLPFDQSEKIFLWLCIGMCSLKLFDWDVIVCRWVRYSWPASCSHGNSHSVSAFPVP